MSDKTCDVQGCSKESIKSVDVVAYIGESNKVDSVVFLCHEHYEDLKGEQQKTSIGYVP